MSQMQPTSAFRTLLWGSALVLFVGWLGCPAPILLPPQLCNGSVCLADSSGVSEAQEPAHHEVIGSETKESPLEPHTREPDAPDSTGTPEQNVGAEPGDAGEHVTRDTANPPEPRREQKPEQKPELRPEQKPEQRPEQRPEKATPTCIDKDKDKICANKIHSTYRIDCDDTDPRVFPKQTKFFATARKRGGWDYNCDGINERLYPKYVCRASTPRCTFARESTVTSVVCGLITSVTKTCLFTAKSCLPHVPYRGVTQACR